MIEPTSAPVIDDVDKVAEIDQSNVLGSIEALADQVKDAWEETQKISFKPTREIKNVVVAGMGGSGLGPDVIKHLYKDQLPVPFEVINSYALPAYVNQNSLVVLSSYSGNTEEVLSCAQQAQDRSVQIMIITSGGKLAELAQKENYPAYIINPQYNPSGQPRMAIGYAIMGSLGLLAQAGLIKFTTEEVTEIVQAILTMDDACRLAVPQEQNRAKLLALDIIDRRPVLVASEFLVGAAHVATNQFNENAKIFADYKLIPEINHHLLEGLQFPKSNAANHLFLFLNSELYQARNQKRMILTQQVVEKKKMDTLAINLQLPSKLAQVFETITLFAYTNFYLAILEKIDPAPIPTVDWFKKQLKK